MQEAYRAALACLTGMNPLALPRLLLLAGGARKLWDILEKGGSSAASLVGSEKAAGWAGECGRTDPSRVLEDLKRRGIGVITPADPPFSDRLRSIYDPPALLFTIGREPPVEAPFVAVVGARKASGYGRWAAESIAEELARRGVVVVSGAAYGVDGRAHRGCLKASGFTIAVLGCGIDRVYPAGHAGLLASIASSGCIVSEYPPGEEPLPWHFPHRNRIIAGLCHAVVVVEASQKSGALITADMALDEGREVMAVPGPIGSTLSRGTNRLIQKGAKLVLDVDDICEELPDAFFSPTAAGVAGSQKQQAIRELEATHLERTCAGLLQGIPRGLDWLAVRTGVSVAELLACLTGMSLKGWVTEEPGGRYRLLTDLSLH